MNLPEQKNSRNSNPRRLGECLLAEGLINTTQLDEAIEYQCIYGGKLGTSLIELGLVDEEQMARVLSRQLHLHYIKPDRLMNVPPAILDLIPDRIALRHQVVPYHEEGRKLYVALNDSGNLKLIDELSFQLNHIIIPLAIPEIRLLLALKKHYGMLLTPRYETLAVQMQRRKLAARKQRPQSQQQAAQQHPQAGPVKTALRELPAEDDWPLLGDADLGDEDQIAEPYSTATAAAPAEESTDILHRLAEARERDDIGRAVIEHVRSRFPECTLFVVRDKTATGWIGSRQDADANFELLTFDLQEQSILSPVMSNRSHYLGAVIDTAQNRQLIDYFRCSLPQYALVVPLTVQERLVSILYVQGPLEKLESHFADLLYVTGKAEMAFKMLILKNKILRA